MEAVHRNSFALKFASPALRDGGLRAHLENLMRHVHTVPKQTSIATILFGAKAPPTLTGSGASSSSASGLTRPVLCDNSDCILSLLLPSAVCLIWDYAGVRRRSMMLNRY